MSNAFETYNYKAIFCIPKCEQASEPSLPASLHHFLRSGSRGGGRACEPGLARKASSPRRPAVRKVDEGLAVPRARLAATTKGRRHFRLRTAFTSFCGALAPLPLPFARLRRPEPRGPTSI